MNRTKTIQAMPVPPVYEQPDSIVIPLEIRLDKRLCPEVVTCIDSGFAVYSKAYRTAFSRINRGQRNLGRLTKEIQDCRASSCYPRLFIKTSRIISSSILFAMNLFCFFSSHYFYFMR